MISDTQLKAQLPQVITETNFSFLGEKYEGKVRDCYTKGDTLFLVTSDRLSCFDKVVTSIPFKGQVLTQLAVSWFERTKDIIENHIIDIPHPNVMVGKKAEILPIELIVRGYITGSAWRDYEAGKAVSGITLPKGLKASQRLPEPLITPSTKAEKGAHDLPISEAEILSSGIVDKKIWAKVKEASLALFKRGQERAESLGLLLVDTKYEFGLYQGRVIICDEIHTLDSSRYWIKASYQDRFARGESPQMLDKEPTRQWLLQQGYKGDGPIPHFTDDHRVEIARHYIKSYEQISGATFVPDPGPTVQHIEKRLREFVGAK